MARQINNIPDGSLLQMLPNGDVFITLPGAMIPVYCVQRDHKVRTAILREPVDEATAQAARDYVARHMPTR